MVCVCTPTQQVQILSAQKLEKNVKDVSKAIKSQTSTFSPDLKTIAARMCAWAAPEYSVSGVVRDRTAELVAMAAIYSSVAALNTYVQNKNYQIARAYTDLSVDRWNRFRNAYVQLEQKMISTSMNTAEPATDYVGAKSRAQSSVSFAYSSAKSTMASYAKLYALCMDDSLNLDHNQALVRDDTVNFNYRDAENYKDYLSDKRWNRRSDVLNLGRNNLPTASSYAQHASKALGDVSNTIVGIGSGLSGLIGYLFNRNETVYPSQFSMASNYGNNAILMGGGF